MGDDLESKAARILQRPFDKVLAARPLANLVDEEEDHWEAEGLGLKVAQKLYELVNPGEHVCFHWASA